MTEIQACSLPHTLAGRDLLGGAQTGSGKTLAYLVVILETLLKLNWSKLDKTGAIIIVPTKELVTQVFLCMQKIGKFHDFSCTVLTGGKSSAEEMFGLEFTNIVIATPGRLLYHLDTCQEFDISNLKVLVLDEVDMLIELGYYDDLIKIFGVLDQHKSSTVKSIVQHVTNKGNNNNNDEMNDALSVENRDNLNNDQKEELKERPVMTSEDYINKYFSRRQTLMFSATLSAHKISKIHKIVLTNPEIIELNRSNNNNKSVMPQNLKQ